MSYVETIDAMTNIGLYLKILEHSLAQVDIRNLNYLDYEQYMSWCEYQRKALDLYTAHIKEPSIRRQAA